MSKTVIPVAALLLTLSVASAAATETAAPSGDHSTDKVSLSGDFRLRAEGIYEDGQDDRERGRYLARLGATITLPEDIKVVVRIATGEGNPVSANQTFGDGFSIGDLGIDRAYVDWKLSDKLRFLGGKMKNPLFRAGDNRLVWDSDFNPTGIAAAFNSDLAFGNLGVFVVDEGSADQDVLIYSAQAGLKFEPDNAGTLTTGVGYFNYSNVVGATPFYKGRAKGNSIDVNGNYLFDYSIVELSVEYKSPSCEWPLTIFGQWAQNTQVDVQDTAYSFGIKLQSTRNHPNMQFSYAYHDTEVDAIIGPFSDSDFAGGNTDSKGHFIKARYVLSDHVALGGTLIIARIGEFAGNERDYDRVMLDVEFSF